MAQLRINLLGGMKLTRGEQALDVGLARKPRALLAYLAMQNGTGQSREKLAGMFWGDRPEAQARANLRQTLSILRKALGTVGDDTLVAEGDNLVLRTASLDVDAIAFERVAGATTIEALERSATLYKGDLLDGFSLREESFDSWANAERARLRRLAVQALDHLVTRYQDQNDQPGALQAATQLLTLDPLNEAAHRAVMQAHAAQGRYAAALKQFESCREILASELSVSPEPETRELYNSLRRLRSAGPDSQAPVGDATVIGGHGAGKQATPQHEGPVVVVLPFEMPNAAPGENYLAGGITENIITGLTRFRSFVVIALESAMAVCRETGDPEMAGRTLGATHLVTGSVVRSAEQVRIAVQLIDATTGRSYWGQTYDREFGDLFALQDEVAEVIVATLAGRIEEAEQGRIREITTQDAAAYDEVLQGRHHLNRHDLDGLLAARKCFERALAQEPRSSDAHAGLALSYVDEYDFTWSTSANLGTLDRAYECARRAVALDPTDSRARYALARVYVARNQHGLARAQIEKAIELNPNDYLILCTKGWFLTFTGEIAEGVACMKDAIRRNPYAPENCLFSMAVADYLEGRFQAAIDTLGPVASAHPAFSAFLAACLARLGGMTEARTTAQEAIGLVDEKRKLELGDDRARWRAFWSKWFPCSNADDFDQIAEGLCAAGLPV
jgi:DNA-binding SARP family transcriptional activator/Tfp pilus assembly protein PilF